VLAGVSLAGEATPGELQELETLLQQNPAWRAQLETLRSIWRAQQTPTVKKEEAYQRHLQRLNAHLPVHQASSSDNSTPQPPSALPVRSLRKWLLPTAAAASLIGLFFLLHHYTGKTKEPLASNTVSTRPGSRSRIQLPDGTQVWLNADSRLTYTGDFINGPREVQLTGEAYFDVAKDKDHPFLIHTKVIDIKVLGTAFNVRSYGDERLTETALVQGSVEVTVHNSPDKKIVLKPNEKLIVHNDQVTVLSGHTTADPTPDEPLITVGKVHFQKKDSSITEILWMKNQLAFDNASLEEVARLLERWYAVKVTIKGNELKTIRLNAVFGDESLSQVMEAIGIAGNFKYSIHNKEVIIGP